jgi:ABC-2 type transport system permease protein
VASYLRLLLVQLRVSVTVAAAYRFQFVLDAVLSLVWIGTSILPLTIALHGRPAVGGWTFDRALVVVGLFTLLKAVLDGAVNPSLIAVVDHIRNGTLDFILMKPKDAQFLVCTSKFDLWRGVDFLAGAGIVAWAFHRMDTAPRPAHVALSVLLLAASTVLLYSLWLLVVTAAFWVVRLDNLAYMFNSLFDFARWPRSVMKGVFRVVFTFVLPLAVMTSYPAEALLGSIEGRSVAFSLGLAAGFAVLSRIFFMRALSRYTSASS